MPGTATVRTEPSASITASRRARSGARRQQRQETDAGANDPRRQTGELLAVHDLRATGSTIDDLRLGAAEQDDEAIGRRPGALQDRAAAEPEQPALDAEP